MNKSVILLLSVLGMAVIIGLAVFFSQKTQEPALINDAMPQTSAGANDTSGTDQTPQEATFTLEEVAQHGKSSDCYTAINGDVYDLTEFIRMHPGGPVITALCGIDGTQQFEAQHGRSPQAKRELSSLRIGSLSS